MKLKGLLIAVFCLLIAGPVAADDDVMITRDGSMMTVKVEASCSMRPLPTQTRKKNRSSFILTRLTSNNFQITFYSSFKSLCL